MCADCAGHKAPAPADFESQFLIWLLYILIEPNFRHNGDGSRFNQMELQLALGSGHWRAKFPPVAALLQDNEAMQTAVDQMIEAIPNPSEMKYMTMPFLVAVGECHSSIRAHFVDEDGRYGITTLSAEEGDEVWIVAGVDTPCVLRPARANEYEFIGEAYVHGIMMGELNDYGLLQETRDIVLV
ncbi:hypothetical protein GP486_001151 [Trichoglossum hirsutum]|uniref:Uncharacterized protein n=1 Tax=Trichoglossum hirsutum TaxID=265104 RepID=A0A9P8LHE0_9PEZI|nr:hypothetical protein GP486_001151 [Trichoglossum hirsutum]